MKSSRGAPVAEKRIGAQHRARILYVQLPDGGGSAISLVELIEGLDRDRYEPVVVFYRPNLYSDRLRSLGVRAVFIEPDAQLSFAALRRSKAQDAGARSPLRRSILKWLARIEKAFLKRRIRVLRDLKRLILEDSRLARRVERIVRDQAPDLVHQNNSPRGCRAAYLGAWMAGVPQVGHVRWLHEYTAIDRWVAGRVDRFIYITEAVRRSCAKLRIPGDREQVIYDPLRRRGLSNGRGGDVRRELGIAPGTKVAASVGRLIPQKGQDDFIKALSALPDELDVCGLVVGSADDQPENRRYEARLRELARQLGIADRVFFMGFREDVGAVMRAADVVVHSANRPEPFGRVIVEAMVAGRPVIATSAGGVVETVEDGRTGVLVPMGDATAIAEALHTLFTDDRRASAIARAGQEHAEARFTMAKHAEEVHAVYDAVLGSGVGA